MKVIVESAGTGMGDSHVSSVMHKINFMLKERGLFLHEQVQLSFCFRKQKNDPVDTDLVKVFYSKVENSDHINVLAVIFDAINLLGRKIEQCTLSEFLC